MFPNRLHEVMRGQMESCIKHVKAALDNAEANTVARMGSADKPGKVWKNAFCSFLRNKGFNLHLENESRIDSADAKVLGIEIGNAVSSIRHAIDKYISTVSWNTVVSWRRHPYQLIMDKWKFCLEKCPFCNEPCMFSSGHNDDGSCKHSTTYHRPQCLTGYRWYQTNEATIELCPSLVAGDCRFRNNDTSFNWHYYKDYQSVGGRYASWNIRREERCLKYWRWFTFEYQSRLEQRHGYKFPELPQDWNDKGQARREITDLI